MSNKNGLNANKFTSKTLIYLIIIAILMIFICVYNYKLIPICLGLFTVIVIYSIYTNKRRKVELSEQLQDLTLDVNNTAKTTLINSPFPLVMLETNGNIIWKSEKFVQEFNENNVENMFDEILRDVKSTIENSENKEKGNINLETKIEGRDYSILGSFVKSKKSHKKDQEYTTILYFIDDTNIKKLEQKEKDEDICVGIIMIDNYEEISQRISAEVKPIITTQVEKMMYDWANKYNALIIKSDRDTFYCIIEKKNLQQAKEDKMSILDDIKNIDLKNVDVSDTIQPTLSIAFSDDGETFVEKNTSARAVIDIALGRGGDQAIVKTEGRFEFFGGRTQEIEKRTKVKARMVSHALKELIQESDNVIIMGHSHGDMDSIGSSMGLYRLTKTLGKEAKVVSEVTGIGLNKFIETAKMNEEYTECFITVEEAKNLIKPNTLLIVVDTNKKNYVESQELLEMIPRVVVIDHHRRSTDYIENAVLTFHEVYASSASELVTEIIEYSQVEVELTTIEIEALYAGIVLDTKNFTFKTGVRTFEAAAYLRKCGVDIIKVKKWFQNDLETYQAISNIVSKSEIINDSIAISIYDKNDKNANIIAAKAADELLTIGGITASFVLGQTDEKVYISGRSIGDINVQIILEKLGGGGHITLAGAQLENISLEDAKQELINRINEYFFEME